jgi:hypothetical protein
MKWRVRSVAFMAVVFFAVLFVSVTHPFTLSANEAEEEFTPLTHAERREIAEPVEVVRIAPVVNWPGDVFTESRLNHREEGLEIRGVIPSVRANTHVPFILRSSVRALITDTVELKIAAAKENKARSITFDYILEFSRDYEIVSVVLISTVATATPRTEYISINFSTTGTGTDLTAAEALGSHIVQLADKQLAEMIRQKPERYNPGFNGLRPDQAYYISDSEIKFFFNEFQLAPASEGIVNHVMRLDQIKVFHLSRDEYLIKTNFNLRMVPIADICRNLGYTVDWNDAERKVEVLLNGEPIIELFHGVNNYQRGTRLVRSLEAPPEIIGGITFVPITFFSQILGMVSYSIDRDDNIIFATYIDREEDENITP